MHHSFHNSILKSSKPKCNTMTIQLLHLSLHAKWGLKSQHKAADTWYNYPCSQYMEKYVFPVWLYSLQLRQKIWTKITNELKHQPSLVKVKARRTITIVKKIVPPEKNHIALLLAFSLTWLLDSTSSRSFWTVSISESFAAFSSPLCISSSLFRLWYLEVFLIGQKRAVIFHKRMPM